MVRRLPGIVLVLVFFGAAVYSDAVLIFTTNSLDPERLSVKELQSAVEDGAMAALFDAGHIVFNAGVVAGNPRLKGPSDRLSMRMAKSGGALFLLEIDLLYEEPETDEEQLNAPSAQYRLYDVMQDTLLTQGSLSPGDVRSREDAGPEELSTALGSAIADHAVSMLRRQGNGEAGDV
ncbi:hypothetical protein [Marispirochaeta aestuarii]|uniref:hypothetical protein n=1 Tax=Marispirochaeta aestuarii TaxID=1963862 RepID=UPI002ABD3607|nr:hypothetical protein [Marispirochaeta aestuarii]